MKRVLYAACSILVFIFAFGALLPVSHAVAASMIITQNTTFAAGEYIFDSLTIASSSKLTLLGNPATTSPFKGVIIRAQQLTIEPGSSISANENGYSSGQGPGASTRSYAGASYGGTGASNTTTSAPTYGSALEPAELGSGGNTRGGGAIRILVSGTFINDGTVSANGGASSSGGSIFVDASTLVGAGSFKALGGQLWDSGYYKQSGGGGRIMIRYASFAFTGITDVSGGCGTPSGWLICGESGTVGLLDTTTNTLFIPQSWRFQMNDSPFSFSRIVVAKGGATSEPGVSISAEEMILSSKASIGFGDDVHLHIPHITVEDTSTISFSGAAEAVIGDMSLLSGSTLTSVNEKALDLSLVNLTIEKKSSVDVSSRGYAAMKGPGAPVGGRSSMGASYGGIGYANTATSTYGSADEPTDFGSGATGRGGGAVALTVSDTLTNNGTIIANGGGSASGGSILVRAHTIIGSGTFSANGGSKDSASYLGPGAGGRIALYTDTATSSFTGTVEAKGACNTEYGYYVYCGGNGTVVVKDTGPKVSNVLFLPGIEASRLGEDAPCESGVCTTKLWEPAGDARAARLAHDASGASVNSIYATGIIDNAYVPIKGNIYKSFIAQMDDLVAAGTVKAWEAIPYDWRLPLEQILTSGAMIAPGEVSYLTATSSPYIIQELKRLAASSKTGKVTIIAHSNGGLLTKALTNKLGSDATKYIDTIIFVAVPQAGTPQAVGALLHGYDQGLPSSVINYGLSDGMARTLAANMPMTYNLVPSASYFTPVDDSVVTFDSSNFLAEFRARYGGVIHDETQLKNFIIDSWRAASSTTEGLNYPSVGNASLLADAEALHTSLDAWAPPAGVALYEIAGWGELTLAGIDYYQGVATHCEQVLIFFSKCTKTPKIDYKPRLVQDGDGTVVAPSALWTPGAKRYWVDLKDYNGFFGTVEHARILETPQLRTLLGNIITNNENAALPEFISTSIPVNTKPDTQLHFTLHSPLTLNLYDDQGRHTGISTTTGELEEDIPESRYLKFGEVQFISVPSSIHTRLVMNGYTEGSFTLDAEEVSGETVVASTTFAGIPTTASAVASLDLPSGGLASTGALVVDENGDGTADISLVPKAGGTVELDITPPELRVTFDPAAKALAFTGTDDSGAVTVTSDTVYPMLKKNEKEKEHGNMHHGVGATTVTARDATGNETVLAYTEPVSSNERQERATFASLTYNGEAAPLATTTAQYKWKMDKKGEYSMFASYLRVGTTTIEARYEPKKDVTIIMTKPRELDERDGDEDEREIESRPIKVKLPGLVIPALQTEQGSVKIIY